jgi:2-amino-4-hydroxy-6-hydroxymethyldihydropteridine diphosphokinase
MARSCRMGLSTGPRVSKTVSGGARFSLETCAGKLDTTAVAKFVYLSLGSNLGDRTANLKSAIARLQDWGEVLAVSSFYETEPIEVVAQPWFLNCAVKLHSERSAEQLLEGILQIEQAMGRQRKRDKGPRIIDIDILLFGDSITETEELTIPHPAMHQRRFVLEPLAEIAPELRHPRLKRTMRELREELATGQAVKKASSS